LSAEAQAQAFAGLSEALLRVAQLGGNAFMTPNVVGTINVLPKGYVFAGGKPAAAAFVELKLPGIALATPEAKQAFIEAATTVVERAAEGGFAVITSGPTSSMRPMAPGASRVAPTATPTLSPRSRALPRSNRRGRKSDRRP
jgi:hypothetical protein